MDHLISGSSAAVAAVAASASSWTSFFLSFVSSTSFFLSDPTIIALLLTVTLVPLVLWIDTIGKDPASTLNKMAVKDPPPDPKADITVNNNPPTKRDLDKVADLPVLDQNKKRYTFKSLYADNEHGPRRVLVIFIRHFFCGVCIPPPPHFLAIIDTDGYAQNCQEYLRTFASSITPESLSALSIPTEVVVIGCGQPHLIPTYVQETGCPFPIYADPTRKLYRFFRLTSTLNLGKSPGYMQRSFISMVVSSFFQELRSGRNMLSGGDYRQVGGEFLFQDGKVTWCHRMKSTRDHAEVPLVRQQLGLDDTPPPLRKRWSAAGIGGGLTRRLSNRRAMSWAAGPRSQSGNKLERSASGMDFLKEDDGEKLANEKGVASGHDVGAHGDDATPAATNGVVTNGTIPKDTVTDGASTND